MTVRLILSLLSLLSCLSLVGCPTRDDDDTEDDDDSALPTGEDADGDGFCAGDACDDEDLSPGDCDDAEDTVYPEADERCDGLDNDCDDRTDENFDADQDGYVDIFESDCVGNFPPELLDCNDQIAAIYPGAVETCDGNDNDCNGLVDDGLDQDFDGFRICDAPADCDDDDPLTRPGAPETCDGEDDNCDGIIDNGVGTEFLDQDGDGYTPCAEDCDDNPQTGWLSYPGAEEACDELDNDCDGVEDEDLDLDGDGSPGPYPGCLQEFGSVDCDDTDATVFPENAEICDTLDNNCDGFIDENLDFDNDGFTSCQGDCASLNPAISPSGIESCNGLDDDCDSTVDEGFDGDGDGMSACAGDCDDANGTIYPSAPELCDQIDNDCNGSIGANEIDQDGDGYSACDGDCSETDVGRNPGSLEICNAIDDDCDGATPAGELDADLDGYVPCTPPGCAIALVNDAPEPGFWAGFDALDTLGLDTAVFDDALGGAWLTDMTNFEDSQVIVWSTGGRELSQGEYDSLVGWLAAGNGLVVTGDGVLASQIEIGDDDDDDDDDDDSAPGDDDDSAPGDDDDSAGGSSFSPSTIVPIDSTRMRALVGSLTAGVGPSTASCAISNTSTPITNGPYGSWTMAYSFQASGTAHDNAIANPALGAIRAVSVGSRAKVLHRGVIGGGTVVYWNGDGLADWAPGFSSAMRSMLGNAVADLNSGCGGGLQGGDCDDTNPTLRPGTCP